MNKILVTNNEVREHELKIEFRLPYVGDKFEYNDPSSKSKGYTIKKGRKTKKVVTDLLKKNNRIGMGRCYYISKFIPSRWSSI